MEFKPIPCHESLRPFIRNYWMLSSWCTATGTQQIFSNGAASLQYYLSQDIRIDDGDRRYRTVLYHQNMQKVGVVTDKAICGMKAGRASRSSCAPADILSLQIALGTFQKILSSRFLIPKDGDSHSGGTRATRCSFCLTMTREYCIIT